MTVHPINYQSEGSRRQSMADNTPVNGQISDSVSQTNVEVLASAPAMAMGATYQSLGHSTGLLFESSVGSQQQLAIAAQAAANQGVIQMYTVNTMAGVAATNKIANSGTSDTALSTALSLAAVKNV